MRTEFRYDLWGHAPAAAGAFVFAVPIPIFFAIKLYDRYQIERFLHADEIEIWGFAAGGVVILFLNLYYGRAFLLFVRRILRRNVILRIDDRGVCGIDSGFDPIPWGEIEDYEFRMERGRDWLVLKIPDAERFSGSEGEVSIFLAPLDAKPDEIMDVFEHYWQKSQQAG